MEQILPFKSTVGSQFFPLWVLPMRRLTNISIHALPSMHNEYFHALLSSEAIQFPKATNSKNGQIGQISGLVRTVIDCIGHSTFCFSGVINTNIHKIQWQSQRGFEGLSRILLSLPKISLSFWMTNLKYCILRSRIFAMLTLYLVLQKKKKKKKKKKKITSLLPVNVFKLLNRTCDPWICSQTLLWSPT